MTEQERLEEIERRTDQLKNISQEVITWQGWKKTCSVLQDDYKYLIEQARRVEEQQKEIERLEKFIDNLQVVHFTELQTEKAENQRYKQVLEFYADESSYIDFVALQIIEPTVMIDKGEKARQELEKCK